MLRFITLVLLCTWYLHIHTAAEQVSKIPLTLTFSNNLSTTIEEPFLGRFIALYQKTEQPGEHSVHIPNTVTPTTALALRTLIAKPINALQKTNLHGHDSDALLEAAQILGIRTDVKLHEQQALNLFTQAFIQAVIKKEAVIRWCVEAQQDLINTKKLPNKKDNHQLNKLRYLMKWAQEPDRALINKTAYETQLMHSLYTHMYTSVIQVTKPNSAHGHLHLDAQSHAHLGAVQKTLFNSTAWHYYAALHNVFNADSYPDLLYGNTEMVQEGTLFPTRHFHVAFHDNTDIDRDEYTYNNKPIMPHEITTTYHDHSQQSLSFKPVFAASIATTMPQKMYFLTLDALLFSTLITTKKPSYVSYNFSGHKTEIEIAPDAYKALAKLTHSVHINLGTISPRTANEIEQHIESLAHRIKISNREFTGDEYKQFHRNDRSLHNATRLHAPVTHITFLDKGTQPGATITYATIDPTISCSCR